jgi:hypothetical protein
MSPVKRLAAATAAATLLLTAGAVAVREEAHGQKASIPAAATTASTPKLCAALLPSLPGFCITI